MAIGSWSWFLVLVLESSGGARNALHEKIRLAKDFRELSFYIMTLRV